MDGERRETERLETSRLVLVPISLVHSSGMFALWSNAEVCRYSGPIRDYDGLPIASPVRDAAQSDRIIDFWMRARLDGWGVRWAMCDRESGAFVGATGFNSLGPLAEYAYHLLPEHWHKGLMSEATEAVFEWARNAGCTEVEAFIDPGNINSIAFAERNGFKLTGEITDQAERFVRSLVDRG